MSFRPSSFATSTDPSPAASFCNTPPTCTFATVCSSSLQTLEPCTTPATSGQLVAFENVANSSGITLVSSGTQLLLPTAGLYEANFSVTAMPTSGCVLSFRLLRTPAGSTIAQTVPCSVAANTPGCNNIGTVTGFAKFSAAAGDLLAVASNLAGATEIVLSAATTPIPTPLSIVNHAFHQDQSNAASTISVTLTVAAGDSIYVAVQEGSGQMVTTVADNVGGVYTQAGSTATNGLYSTSIWFTDASAGGSVTVTATFSGICPSAIEVIDVSGTATPSLDAAGPHATGTSAQACATVTSSAAGDLGFMSVVALNPGGTTFVGVAPATVVDGTPAQANSNLVMGADLIDASLSVPATYSMCADVAPTTSTLWAAVAVSIRPAQVTPPPPVELCDTPNTASLDVKLLCPAATTTTTSPCPQRVSSASLCLLNTTCV